MEKKISKEHLAVIQLRDALKLYYDESYISAITLSGAAEEILGQLAKSKTRTNSLELDSFLFREILGVTNYQQERNRLRNELKHKFKGIESTKYSSFKKTAELHISAAIMNLKLAKGFIPENEPLIVKYCAELGIN